VFARFNPSASVVVPGSDIRPACARPNGHRDPTRQEPDRASQHRSVCPGPASCRGTGFSGAARRLTGRVRPPRGLAEHSRQVSQRRGGRCETTRLGLPSLIDRSEGSLLDLPVARVPGRARRLLMRLIAEMVAAIDLERPLHQSVGQQPEHPLRPGDLLLGPRVPPTARQRPHPEAGGGSHPACCQGPQAGRRLASRLAAGAIQVTKEAGRNWFFFSLVVGKNVSFISADTLPGTLPNALSAQACTKAEELQGRVIDVSRSCATVGGGKRCCMGHNN
jgi:hypothetical protein